MKVALCLLFLLPFGAQAQPGTDSLSTKLLQPADLRADFRYLRRLLQETHPGLYRYTPKERMQAKLDSLDQSLSQPMPFYAFFKAVSALLADVRCAHTHALPHKKWQEQSNNTLKTLPIFLWSAQGRSFVLFNGTPDPGIKPGFELLAINGQPMEAIREQAFRYHWRDGFIESSREQAVRGQLFALFYYWYIAQPETFTLTFRTRAGDTSQFSVPAQPFAVSWKAMKTNPVNRQMLAWYNAKKPKHPWRLSFPDSLAHTALLRLDAFGGEGARNGDEAIRRFRAFMDKTMARLVKKQTRHLIVDVRSNTGGWDSQGIELFTYLMKTDSAVPYYARQHSITDSTEFLQFSDLSAEDRKNVRNELSPEPDGTFTLKQGNTTHEPKRYPPKPNRFRGNVYVLMNGQSVSTASEFLAVAHANRVGVFVGEESGGAYEGGNGGSFITLTLPRSGIEVTTPLVHYDNAVPQPGQKGRGTLPEHGIPVLFEDILTKYDRQLEFVKKLIRDKEQR